jgi:hypothetical protein
LPDPIRAPISLARRPNPSCDIDVQTEHAAAGKLGTMLHINRSVSPATVYGLTAWNAFNSTTGMR